MLAHIERLYTKLLGTTGKKNTDYTGDASAFFNFEVTGMVAGVTTEQAILVQIANKVARAGKVTGKKEVNYESAFDTLEDLIVYATLLHALLASKESSSHEHGDHQMTHPVQLPDTSQSSPPSHVFRY